MRGGRTTLDSTLHYSVGYNKTPFAISTSRRGFVCGGSNELPVFPTTILYHSQISSIAVLIKA